MSGNVHPNPGPIFPCSVCAGNVTWRGKSVQCCTCSKRVPSKVLTTFLIPIQSSRQLSLLKLPPCRNTMTLSSDSFDMYTSTVQSAPPPFTDAALSPHPRLQTPYPPLAHSISPFSASSPPSLAPGRPSTPPASSPPPESLRVLQWNARGLQARSTELFYFLSSHPSTLSVSRNPILTPLPLSGFRASLLCVLIALTPGLAFYFLMPRTLAAALSFSSGRAYLFLNFSPPLFLRSIPTLIMLGS